MLSAKQVAAMQGIGLPALRYSIKAGKLNAVKREGKWYISQQDFLEYKKNRYSRALSRHNGELVFDKAKGFHSATEASQILKCPVQHVYYVARRGTLPAIHKGGNWVIHIDDIMKYKERVGKRPKKTTGNW